MTAIDAIVPYRHLRFCAWGGPVLLVVLIVFWGLLGYNIPPYSSAAPAEAIAAHFRDHTTHVRIGMLFTMAFSVLYVVWGIAISRLMEAIAPTNALLSTLQTWGAGLTTLVLLLPASIWLTAAFRPDELDPRTIQLLYDAGWIFFDCAFSATVLQLIPMGIAFLADRRERPLIPNWVSWYTIWVGCMLPLLGLIAVFKDGPFSRSGLINYWIEFPIFFLFMLLVSIFVIKAIDRLERENVAIR